MDDNKKKIAGAVIGIALIGLLLWYFIFSKKPAIPKTNNPTSTPPPKSTSTPAQTTQTVIYNTTVNDPNVVGREGTFSQYVKNVQNHLMKEYNVSLPRFGADGFLGEETYIGLNKKFPSIGANVKANKRITKSQYDTIMAAKASTSTSSPSPSPIPSKVDFTNRVSLESFITNNTTNENPDRRELQKWSTASLVEWVKAIQDKKDFFYCSTCWSKKNYFTYRKK